MYGNCKAQYRAWGERDEQWKDRASTWSSVTLAQLCSKRNNKRIFSSYAQSNNYKNRTTAQEFCLSYSGNGAKQLEGNFFLTPPHLPLSFLCRPKAGFEEPLLNCFFICFFIPLNSSDLKLVPKSLSPICTFFSLIIKLVFRKEGVEKIEIG